MAVRDIVSCVLPVGLFIALVARGEPVLGDEPTSGLRADLTARVDGLFEGWNRPDSPGCAVGIVHHGQLIYSRGFGSANLEYQVPNTPQTVFDVGSFSKSLTCVCLALLMDEGKISPDDDLRKFVPEMHRFDPPIRIEDMVRCRSGLWDQVSLPILVGVPRRHAPGKSLVPGSGCRSQGDQRASAAQLAAWPIPWAQASAIHGGRVGHQCCDEPVSRPRIHGHLPEQ